MNVEDYEWIGTVNPEDVKLGMAFITPSAYYCEGAWKPIVPDARRQWFPSNGKAVIFKMAFPRDKIGRLWLFHLKRNAELRAPTSYEYSYYLVSDELEPPPLAQVIDWTAKANHSFELTDLLEQGIAAKDCFCQRVYVYCQSRLYGPIRLELDNDRFKPREYLQSSNAEGQPLFVWMYTLPEDGILDLTNVHAQFTFLDESMLDTPTGKEDWSLTEVIIKRVLQTSEALSNTEDHVHLIDKHLNDLACLDSRERPFALQLDSATLERAQYIVSNQSERLQDLHAIFDQLSAEHPLMKAARAWEIQERSKEIEGEAEALALERRNQLQQLQAKIEEAAAVFDSLENAVKVTQIRHEQAIEAFKSFEQEMQRRLVILKEEPWHMLAELQMIAPFLPMLTGENRQATSQMNTQQPHPTVSLSSYQNELQAAVFSDGLAWGSIDGSESIVVRLKEFQKNRWIQAAQQAGINSKGVRMCAAAFLAGLIPAVSGEAAIPTLQTVAKIIAHDRISLIPVPLTALTALDLFGAIDSHRQMFVPATGGLADCILQAQLHPDELVVIVLEGIDRVPGMPAYVPLLRQYIELRQIDGTPASKTPVNLFHPRALASDDAYLKLAWFTWPRNILLAVTLDSDINSLPLPSVCDRWLVQMEPVRIKNAPAPVKKTFSAGSGVSFEGWQKWEQEVRSQPTVSTVLWELLDHRQKAFYTALTLLNVKNPETILEDTWPEQFQQEDEETH